MDLIVKKFQGDIEVLRVAQTFRVNTGLLRYNLSGNSQSFVVNKNMPNKLEFTVTGSSNTILLPLLSDVNSGWDIEIYNSSASTSNVFVSGQSLNVELEIDDNYRFVAFGNYWQKISNSNKKLKFSDFSYFTGTTLPLTYWKVGGNSGLTLNPDIGTLDNENVNIISSGVTQINVTPININTKDILPQLNSTYDLGSTDFRWRNIYANTFIGNVTLSGFTQGSVLFAGAGGVVSEDSSFIWNESTNRLGIRVALPLDAVHLSGNLRIQQSQPATNSNINNIFFVNSNITNSPLASISFNTESFSSSTNLVFSTASTGILNEVFRITSNRNFLLGTTSNLARLTTVGAGATSATWTAQFHNSTGTSNTLMLRDDGRGIFGGTSLGDSTSIFDFKGEVIINTVNLGLGGGNISTNTRVGFSSLAGNTTGSNNTSLGFVALATNTTGGNNIAIGFRAGRYFGGGIVNNLTIANQSIFIGSNASPSGDNQTNQIVIGHEAIGRGSNSAQWGNTSIQNHFFNGRINSTATYTANQNNDFGWNFTGTLTARNTTGDTLNGILINPTLVANANSQILASLFINPTFNLGAFTSVTPWGIYVNSAASYFGGNVQIQTQIRDNVANAIFTQSSSATIINRTATFLNGTYSSLYISAPVDVGLGITSGVNARLHVRGQGDTSATRQVLFQNSSGVDSFDILNDNTKRFKLGIIQYGQINQYITNNGLYLQDANGRATKLESVWDSSVSSFWAYNYGAFSMHQSTAATTPNLPLRVFSLSSSFSPVSGSQAYSTFMVSGSINQTGTASGITRGIYVSESVNAFDYRAIEVANGKSIFNDILPLSDLTYDLGKSNLRWRNIYGNLIGTVSLSGYTPGSVLFVGSGGTITEDNANFFWDNTSKILNITGTADGVLLKNSNTLSTRSVISNIGFTPLGNLSLDVAEIRGYYYGTGTDRTGAIAIGTRNNGNLRLVFFGPDGQILSRQGIPPTSFLAKLEIYGLGTTSSTWTAQFHDSTGTSNTLLLRDDGVSIFGSASPTIISGTRIFSNGDIQLTSTNKIKWNNVNENYIISTVGLSPNNSVRFGITGVDRWVLGEGGRSTFSVNYTGTTNNDYGWRLNGSITAQNAGGDTLHGLYITPTLIASANNQILATLTMNASYTTGGFSPTQYNIYQLSSSQNFWNGSHVVSGTQAGVGYLLSRGSGLTGQLRHDSVNTFLASSTGTVFSNGANQSAWVDANNNWFFGTTSLFTPTARIHVRGSSSVSGNALLVENSTSAQLFKVENTGIVTIGQSSVSPFADWLDVRGTVDSQVAIQVARTTTSTDRHFRIFAGGGFKGLSTETSSAAYILEGVTNIQTSGTRLFFNVISNFSPTSGNATWSLISLTPTINQTGGASGITRGLYINPTLTSAFDYRAIETDNNTGWQIYAGGTASSFYGGNVRLQRANNIDLIINGAASGAYAGLSLNSNSTSQWFISTQNNLFGGALLFGRNGFTGTPSMLIDLTDNLGVGLSSGINARTHIRGSSSVSGNALLVENSTPSALFTVFNAGGARVRGGVLNVGNTDTQQVILGADGSNIGYVGTSTNHPFILRSNNSNRVIIDENGRVAVTTSLILVNASAQFQVDSTTRGFLPPRMTDSQVVSISSPAVGLEVYNTTYLVPQSFDGLYWNDMHPLQYQTTGLTTGLTTMVSIPLSGLTACFVKYVVFSGTNYRAGEVYVVHNGTNVEFTDNSTNDLGDTTPFVFTVDINSGNIRIRSDIASGTWNIKMKLDRL